MQSHSANASAFSPRVFRYSLDWRFLLPLAEPEHLRLLTEGEEDFLETLEQVGIHSSQRLSDLEATKSSTIQTLVVPFGIPVSWAGERTGDQAPFYAAAHRKIVPGGFLLIGFNNAWKLRSEAETQYYPSTPRRITLELMQGGFRSVEVFGAMPNLATPEYIFDMDARTVQFALQNRFRRKPAVLRALRVLSATVGTARLSSFFPCYFALARA